MPMLIVSNLRIAGADLRWNCLLLWTYGSTDSTSQMAADPFFVSFTAWYFEWLKNGRDYMANNFGTDILIQAEEPKKAALFYVTNLGFAITDEKPNMISLHGEHINLF